MFGSLESPAPSTAPSIFDVVVREVVRETADTVTLVFDAPPDVPSYRAGQYLSIAPRQFPALASQLAELEALKGRKELVRAYSMASAPAEPLAITIKEEPYVEGVTLYRPLLSPYLVHHVTVGMRIEVLGFTGPYNLPDDIEERTDHLLHVVAGSGVVPNWSMLKFALQAHPRLRHTFVYSNKTWDEVIFRDALDALAKAQPERLTVVHTLTRQTVLPPFVRQGRVTRELLAQLPVDPQRAFAYVCGPAITPWDRRVALTSGITATPRFLEATLFHLKELGFTRDRIRHESYG
ncbi:MAG: oxidoreductase [Myxococcaceae bacterium]|nr:oxidoreductase [Myxococcaceae bacterium]